MGTRLISGLVALSLVTAACAGGEAGDDGLEVVVSTSILGDIVEQVVGGEGRVEVLMPIGADPHDFTASASQVAAIGTADLVVVNGLGLEQGLADVLDAARADGATILEVGPLVDPVDLDGDPCDPTEDGDDHGEDGDDHDDEHAHGDCDPHVWMDPVRAGAMAEAVAAALPAASSGTWEANASAFVAEMQALGAEIDRELSVIPADRRVLVTNHDSLGYFALRYDFEVVGTIVPGGSTLAEPSSRELAELVATMEAAGVDVVFAETTEPTTLADALAAELGGDASVVELYTGSLGGPGSGAETLADMLAVDARLIAEALG
jgi:zinc/manganese transport system substrate-binding protein